MKDKLFIADKIKVGFNPRTDTYTGRLAYVIGHDGKKWRKEPSWESWRYNYIEPSEYEKLRLQHYNQYVEQQKKWHQNIVEAYNKQPKQYDYYQKQALMTEEDFLKTLEKFERFQPNISNISKDPKMKVEEYENVPIEGFVLNKKAGGYSSGWNHRATYCRVYDPRGFEFEISIPNLLFILQECNAYKGKGLEGEFVYAWDGKDLVLLPTSSSDYQESKKFTELQSGKVSAKELVEGGVYKDKQMKDYVYLGKFHWVINSSNSTQIQKMFIFYNIASKCLAPFPSMSNFTKIVDTNPVSNYAELLDLFNTSKNVFKGLNGLTESDYIVKQTIEYSRDTLLDGYLKVGEGQYEVYKIEADDFNYNRYYKREIKSYTLTCNKILVLNGDGYSIKSIDKKELNELTYDKVKQLKLVNLIQDNKKIYFLK